MSIANQTITAPVSISDVRRILSRTSRDVGTLCVATTINKWAKYKPVRRDSVNTVTGQWDAQNNTWLPTATWWKNTGTTDSANTRLVGSCGLEYEVFSDIGDLDNTSSFIYRLMAGDLPWNYVRPVGGAASPYRLQDFAGYVHDAEAVISNPMGSEVTVYVTQTGSDTQFWFAFEVPSVGAGNLSLSDFRADNNDNGLLLTDCYLGVVLRKVNTQSVIIVTSTVKIGTTGSASIEASLGYSDRGDFELMPFISSRIIGRSDSLQTGRYLSAGIQTPITVHITADGSVRFSEVSGELNAARTEVAWTVEIANETSSPRTFSSLFIGIYEGSPAGTLIGSATKTSVTVTRRNTLTLSGTIQLQQAAQQGQVYWIVVSDQTSGSTVRQKTNQIEEYSGMND